MKRKSLLCGILLGLLGGLSLVTAQEEIFQRGVELGIGSRALGMGGAYIGVADDYSAGFWNPAGLTQIRRLEGFGTLSYTQRKNDASLDVLGLRNLDEVTSTNVNSIGLAYPVPTYQGSLVFSLGYHRIKPFDSNLLFSWANTTPEDSVSQSWSEIEEGSLNNWTFAGALEVAPSFSLGAALNVWTGKDDYLFSFEENDNLFDLYTVNKFRKDNTVTSTFTGYNVKLGGMYRPVSNFRLGFTIATPVTYTVKDEWRESERTTFDDRSVDETSDRGTIEYKIRSPFSFGAGASLNVANLLLAASVENTDWTQARYVSDPPFDGVTKIEANEELARKYRNTTRYHLGAEFTFPLIDLQVRGGYFYDPTPLGPDYFSNNSNSIRGAQVPQNANREFFTAGVGIFLDKQVRLDVGVITGRWNDYKDPLTDFVDDTDDDLPISEKITFNKLFAALAFRF
jgi:long-subunit fatty acid transport protein